MEILSHRGYWTTPGEMNSRVAFERSISSGFGTETDVRDCVGKLVVSHDPPKNCEIPWSEVVSKFDRANLTLAVNIKSDGLAPLLKRAFAGTKLAWFAFDMSGPEMFRYAREGLPFFTRHSDIENEPVLYNEAAGVWLDDFSGNWISAAVVTSHLRAGKRVCVVSPELHGRDPENLWRSLKALADEPGLALCTDRPHHARAEGL
jgi:glycerophosphoryl diester phosphodiesterase